MTPCKLKAPLSRKDVEGLRIGDLVTLTGNIFTARSQFHIKFIEKGIAAPFDAKENNVMIHSGPIASRAGSQWKIRAMSITTSIRFDKWEPKTIQNLGLRALIGKGKVGKETRRALQSFGCVHLGKTGPFGGAYATMVEAVNAVHWLELGLPEATWMLRVKDFGPLVVTADTCGNCLFDELNSRVHSRVPAIYRRLGIEGFKFAEH